MTLKCVSIAESDINKMIASAKKASLKKAELVELRLDKLKNLDPESIAELKKKIALPLIGTIRASWEGGSFKGSEEKRTKLIKAIINNKYDYVDLELRTEKKRLQELIRLASKNGANTIISYHNFKKTPKKADIYRAIKKCAQLGNIAKVAFNTKNNLEALKILEAAAKAQAKKLRFVALGMGGSGELTRVLAPALSEELVYLALEKGKESVKGQIDIESFRSLIPRQVDSKTKICGLLGSDLKYSFSPQIHNAAFRESNLNFIYLIFDVKAKYLKSIIKFLKTLEFRGLNVTIPFKECVIRYLDELDKLAAEIGAVNTIVNEGGKLVGYNTDMYGAVMALKTSGIRLKGKETLVLGAGGAARAVAYVLLKKRAKVIVANRTLARAEKLVQDFKSMGELESLKFEDLKQLKEPDIVINCTPVSEKLLIPQRLIKERTIVFDLVYSPLNTKLLSLAAKKGAKTISGLEMLVHQGAKAFELFTNGKAPLATMRSAALEAIK